ncbi:hypothetical protein KY328_03965 [Candidatus Woesearchaeota archaeon]|nr:hypothetical protein [Candidatus Woesearchaeota archaeon]MBW3022053.1 hypothetical protein [Candidatus Woesearchaeota archaeon]
MLARIMTKCPKCGSETYFLFSMKVVKEGDDYFQKSSHLCSKCKYACWFKETLTKEEGERRFWSYEE